MDLFFIVSITNPFESAKQDSWAMKLDGIACLTYRGFLPLVYKRTHKTTKRKLTVFSRNSQD